MQASMSDYQAETKQQQITRLAEAARERRRRAEEEVERHMAEQREAAWRHSEELRKKREEEEKRAHVSGIIESLSMEIELLPDISEKLQNLLCTQNKTTSEVLKNRFYSIRESGFGSDDRSFDKEATVLFDYHESLGNDGDGSDDPELLRLYLMLLRMLSPKEIKSIVQLIKTSKRYNHDFKLKDQLSSIIDLLSWLSQNAYLTGGVKQALMTGHSKGCLLATSPTVIKKILKVLQAIQVAAPPEKIEEIFIRFISCEITYPYPILIELLPDIPILVELLTSEDAKITYAAWHNVLHDSCKKFTISDLQFSTTSELLNNHCVALRFCYEQHIEPFSQLFVNHQSKDFGSLIDNLKALSAIKRLDNVTAFIISSLRTQEQRLAYIQTVSNISDDKWHTSADISLTAVSVKTSDCPSLMESSIDEWFNLNQNNSALFNRILLTLYKKRHHNQICSLPEESAAWDLERYCDTELGKLLDSYHAALHKQNMIQTVETYYQKHQIGLPVMYSTSTSVQEPCITFVIKEKNTVCFDPLLPMPEALKKAIAEHPTRVNQEADQKQLEEKLYDSLFKKLGDTPNSHVSFFGYLSNFDKRLKPHFDGVNAYNMKKSRLQGLQREIEQQIQTISETVQILEKEFNQNYQDPNFSWFNEYYPHPLIEYALPFSWASYIACFIGFCMLIAGLSMIGGVILGAALLTIAGTVLIEQVLDPMFEENVDRAEDIKHQAFLHQLNISPKLQNDKITKKELEKELSIIKHEVSQFDSERESLIKTWSDLRFRVNESYRTPSNNAGMFSRKEISEVNETRRKMDAESIAPNRDTNRKHSLLSAEFERELQDPNSWFSRTRREMDAELADPNSETNRTHARLRSELERDLRDPNSWYNQNGRSSGYK